MQDRIRVTVVTADAERDDLSEQDYREIYNELRGQDADQSGRYGVSLDRFVGVIGSQFSKGLWSKWHRWWTDESGASPLNRAMRSELRRAVGLAPLPVSVGEAVAGVDPNAQVVQVGDRRPDRVVLVGVDRPIRLHINGTVRVVAELDGGEEEGKPRIGTNGHESGSDLRRDYRPRVRADVRAAMQAAGFASAEAAILYAVARREEVAG